MQIHPEIKREAMRIARRMVREAIHAQGCKMSYFRIVEIDRAALEVIKQVPEVIHEAWGICKMRYEAARHV